MPARQRGWVRKRTNGWTAHWREGGRGSAIHSAKITFPTKTVAADWLDEHLEGGTPRRGRDVTFAAHVERYLRIHGAGVQASTIKTLRDRLGAEEPTEDEAALARRAKRRRGRPYLSAIEAFGEITLAELESMSVEIAEWGATLPPGYRYGIMRSLRQVLDAAVRWKLIRENSAKEAGPNPQPLREEVAFFESLADVDKLDVELGPTFGAIATFGVETGLRPSEWSALERKDIDRQAGLVRVGRSVVDGKVKEYGKTARSRRSVPLTSRAATALEQLPPRLDTPLLFPAPRGGYIDLDNFRRRDWRPAVEAAGLDKEALSPYSMRHTYASFALAAGVPIFELARIMGTSVKVIDETYGHLVRGSLDRVRQALEERAARESNAVDAAEL